MGISVSSGRKRIVEDFLVKVEFYRWSSEEFREEIAIVFTSRSNPSLTCISHYRVKSDKVLFTFHDCLYEDNPIRVDMEFVRERDCNGHFVGRYAHTFESGRFTSRNNEPGMYFVKYQDIFGHRKSLLRLQRLEGEEGYMIEFRADGHAGGSAISCHIEVRHHPSEGLEIHSFNPSWGYEDDNGIIDPVAACYAEHISGMPPHEVVKRAHVKQSSDLKVETQDNKGGAPLSSTQSNAVLNAGQTQGNFNGSTFKDCHVLIGGGAMKLEGFHSSYFLGSSSESLSFNMEKQ